WVGCEYKPQTTTEAGLRWMDPYFLNRVVATGKVMKPVLAQRQKVVSPP
ncbi:hydroxypyruvate isomerase, partial [Shigella sonnei]